MGTIGSHTKTSARAVDMLTALLADPSPQVRVNALGSLGFARQPRTLPVIHRLTQDDSAQVRAWVAIALGRFLHQELQVRQSLTRWPMTRMSSFESSLLPP